MSQRAVMARGIPATFGAGPARFGPAVKPDRPYCVGLGWVLREPSSPVEGLPRIVANAARDVA
jgi:hypothetical protein